MSAVRTEVVPGAPARVDLHGLGAFPWPQVNLLPPDIRSRRTLGRVKRRLALVLLLVLLIAALGFVFALLSQSRAAQELTRQQNEVAQLVSEQATYVEVPLIKGQILQAESARLYGMSSEVIWTDFLRAIQAVTPAEVRIQTLMISAPSPMLPSVPSTDPLATGTIGYITFTGSSATLPDVASWLDGLDSVPGFSGASFSSAEITDEQGAVSYEVTSTVQVDESIFANRFAPKEAE